jgi:hypothetical protein
MADVLHDAFTLFQPGQYLMHHKSPRGANGILLGENLLMAIDPKWVGLPYFIGQTYCVYAMPGYDRTPIQAQMREPIVPFMIPNLDAEKSVPFESLTKMEQELILAGQVIADPKRFVWNLIAVHPKILMMRTDQLFLVTDEMPISLNKLSVEQPALAEHVVAEAENSSSEDPEAEPVAVNPVNTGLSEASASVTANSQNGENMQ